MNVGVEQLNGLSGDVPRLLEGINLGDITNVFVALATIALAIIAWKAQNAWMHQQDREFRRDQGMKLLEHFEFYSEARLFFIFDDFKIEENKYSRGKMADALLMKSIDVTKRLDIAFRIMEWSRIDCEKLFVMLKNDCLDVSKGSYVNDEHYGLGELRKRITRIALILILDEKKHKKPPEPD